MPIRASTKAAPTPTTRAGMMSTDFRKIAAAIAAGIAATARIPNRIAETRAGLLLLIRAAVGRGRHRAADYACDGDEGEDVRQGQPDRLGTQHAGGGVVVRRRDAVGERGREAEEAGGAERPERPPLAEDDRRERDEPLAAGHSL